MKKDPTFWIVLIISIIAIVPLACVDFVMAWLYTRPISPSIFIYYALPYLLIMLPFVVVRFNRQKIGLVIAFIFTIALIYYTPWSSRKLFLHDLYSIKPGMSVAEVETRMKLYVIPFEDDTSENPIPISPEANQDVVKEQQDEFHFPDKLVYRHSNNGLFNADLGIVHLKDGIVESVEFEAD